MGEGLCGALASLDLSGNAIGDSAHVLFGANGPKLIELSLADAGVGASLAGVIGSSERASLLERLDLSGNRMSLGAIASLAGSRALSNLEHLDLSRTGLGDDGLSLIARAFPRLVSLGLRDDGITPEGLAAFLERAQLPRLAYLDVSENALGPEGASRLASSRPAVGEPLGGIGGLAGIRAVDCGFSEDHRQALIERAPHLAVHISGRAGEGEVPPRKTS
jgi:Ran GTPase-activating protein (RanGAP) involved in mRNA processing and transport